MCVCDLEELLALKQSKLSYHLKKLVDANILIAEKHGTWNYYIINEQQIQLVLKEAISYMKKEFFKGEPDMYGKITETHFNQAILELKQK